MQWSHWFAGLMDVGPSDRLYDCLPMYHSVGGVLATGAVLAGGGSVVIRKTFSARQFWRDIVRWDCTLFQYVGELCRYLLHTARRPREGSPDPDARAPACGLTSERLLNGFAFHAPRVPRRDRATSRWNGGSRPGATGVSAVSRAPIPCDPREIRRGHGRARA
jgi:fatty-acyl-CoA synthase